jgi:MFS family permease
MKNPFAAMFGSVKEPVSPTLPRHTKLERVNSQPRMERQGSRERVRKSNDLMGTPPLERKGTPPHAPLERLPAHNPQLPLTKPLDTRLAMPPSFLHKPEKKEKPMTEKPKIMQANSHPYTVSTQDKSLPPNTKKLRMRSFLWIKPTTSADKTSSIFAQLLPVLAVNLGALSSGLALGYSAILLPQLRPDEGNSSASGDDDINKSSTRHLPFTANQEEGSWIASIFGLGAIVGGLSAAYLGNRFGRRVALMCLVVPDLLSWVLVATAQNLPMMLVGRFLAGLAAAGYSPNIQIFVAEIAQPVHRGWLSGITVPVLGLGTLLMYVLGTVLPWHLAAAACTPVPTLALISLLLLWDSPYWYLQCGREKQAHKALQMYRGSDVHVVSEIFQIHQNMAQQEKISFSFIEGLGKIFADRRYYRPFVVLNVIFMLTLFSGKFAIEFNAVEIFQKAGGHMDEHFSAITISAIHLVGSLLFIPFVKRYSRKLLLIGSSLVMAISLTVLGAALYIHADGMDWIPLTCVITYMLADPIGLGSIPFIYVAEFFPSEMRSVLGSLTIAISNLELFAVVKTFPNLEGAMGDHGVFWLYAGACIGVIIFVLSYVPETKDKSFAEVEEKFLNIHKKHQRQQVSPWVSPLPSPGTSPNSSLRKLRMSQLQFTQ